MFYFPARTMIKATMSTVVSIPWRSILRISGKSNVKAVAGALAHSARNNIEVSSMLATGPQSINQAIKAIAIAREHLVDNKLDLICYPVFRDIRKSAITLFLNKILLPSPDEGEFKSTLRVACNSDVNKVAGAICARLRQEKTCCLQTIGAECVSNAVYAIILARTFMLGEGIDFFFQVKFTHVKVDEEKKSAIRFALFAHLITK